jgi:hypothetical protein
MTWGEDASSNAVMLTSKKQLGKREFSEESLAAEA